MTSDLDRLNMSAMASMERMAEIQHLKANPAGYLFDRLRERIKLFRLQLSDDCDIGIIAGGGGGAFYVEEVSFSNPDMLIFRGLDADGYAIELMQHHSQLSVTLTALPKRGDRPATVGFLVNGKPE
ncbi:hypothetical protein [Salinarimonas soli]|uniref:Uncharacterized protein n=1 Tax=Salinarimonas soli TaxID=1638099 RepID=A0A5B2VR32_9HYPH|nr:hypothetical protein [Salinarimonas soli]KAA2241128.1 hypothetical protein F0L46_04845 [Salinarimonas soli]